MKELVNEMDYKEQKINKNKKIKSLSKNNL